MEGWGKVHAAMITWLSPSGKRVGDSSPGAQQPMVLEEGGIPIEIMVAERPRQRNGTKKSKGSNRGKCTRPSGVSPA